MGILLHMNAKLSPRKPLKWIFSALHSLIKNLLDENLALFSTLKIKKNIGESLSQAEVVWSLLSQSDILRKIRNDF